MRIRNAEDKQRLYYRLSGVNWKALPVEALRTIDGITEGNLPKPAQKEPPAPGPGTMPIFTNDPELAKRPGWSGVPKP